MLCVANGVFDRVGFAIPEPTEWQRIGNQINAAMIFARADFKKRVQKSSFTKTRVAVRTNAHTGVP
jgi:hypothetical protein